MRVLAAALWTCLAVSTGQARAQLSLAADDAPSDPPWKKPATISYLRSGDGSSHAKVDAVFKYDLSSIGSGEGGATKSTYGVGLYVHRDTDTDAPRKDLGVSAYFGQLIVRDGRNDGPVTSINWNAKISLGRGLQKFDDATGATVRESRTKDRQVVRLSGYYQPMTAGVPVPPDSDRRPDMVMFFDGSTGLYSDHTSGGDGQGNGRLSGGLLEISANFAPFGIDPSARFNRVGNLGVVPTLRLAAQVQRDMAASGSRSKDTYKLYTAEIALAFSKLSGSGVVPSLVIARTYGADLLTGRARSGKTEIAFGMSF